MNIRNIYSELDSWAINIIAFTAFISPFISLFAGLSIAVFFILCALIPTIYYIKLGELKNICHGNLHKIIIIFLFYAMVSIFWAIDSGKSFSLWWRTILVFISTAALFYFVSDFSSKPIRKISKSIIIGFILALVAANIEILSDGFLTKFFRSFELKHHIYNLTDLNRGAAYLSIIFWPVVTALIATKRWKSAIIVAIATIATLARLESQSALIATILGIICTLFIYLAGRRGITFIMVLSVICIAGVATTAKIMKPDELYAKVPHIPNSASEMRVYIWDFAAERAYEKPVFGWGLNASRSIPVSKDDYVLNGRHPLPLHPHNNVLQIWLELGYFGMAIFAAFLIFIMASIKQISPFSTKQYDSKPKLGCNSSFIIRKYENMPMALAMGLFSTYFAIGQTGFGIWQCWWVSSGIIAATFFKICKGAR